MEQGEDCLAAARKVAQERWHVMAMGPMGCWTLGDEAEAMVDGCPPENPLQMVVYSWENHL